MISNIKILIKLQISKYNFLKTMHIQWINLLILLNFGLGSYPLKRLWVFWLVMFGFNATLTFKVIIIAVGDAYVFPSFLTPVLTQLYFPKQPTTFLTCFCRGERRKYTGKKSRLNWGSNA